MGKKHFMKNQKTTGYNNRNKSYSHKKVSYKELIQKPKKDKINLTLKENEVFLFSNIVGSFLLSTNKIIDYILFMTPLKNYRNDFFSNEEILKNEIALINKAAINKKRVAIIDKNHFDILKKAKDLNDNTNSIIFLKEVQAKNSYAFMNSIIYDSYPGIYEKLKDNSLELARQRISGAMDFNFGIINAVKTIESTDKIINTLSRRLQDWSDIFFPEISYKISGIKEFVNAILTILPEDGVFDDKDSVIAKIRHDYDSLGMDYDKSLGSKDIDVNSFAAISKIARQCVHMISLRDDLENFIKKTMDKNARNLFFVAGHMVAAKLIEKAGTLKNLSEMPGSTIQVLGAETAVFRHIRTGARNPKYGILYQHPAVQKSELKIRGRVARAVANKIAIAARIDFFKGDFSGDKLKSEIENKFSVSW